MGATLDSARAFLRNGYFPESVQQYLLFRVTSSQALKGSSSSVGLLFSGIFSKLPRLNVYNRNTVSLEKVLPFSPKRSYWATEGLFKKCFIQPPVGLSEVQVR